VFLIFHNVGSLGFVCFENISCGPYKTFFFYVSSGVYLYLHAPTLPDFQLQHEHYVCVSMHAYLHVCVGVGVCM